MLNTPAERFVNFSKLSKTMSKTCDGRRMNCMDAHERFTRLLIEHEPELLRCVLVAVPNRADARDIMQECSVALWRRFAEFNEDRPFVPWALGFVRIEVRRFLRKSQRRAQLTERAVELLLQDEASQAGDLGEREQYLHQCLRGLSEDQRGLIDGYYREERSVTDLSRVSGRTVDAVYKMLQRIRLSLQQCIELRMRGAQV